MCFRGYGFFIGGVIVNRCFVVYGRWFFFGWEWNFREYFRFFEFLEIG